MSFAWILKMPVKSPPALPNCCNFLFYCTGVKAFAERSLKKQLPYSSSAVNEAEVKDIQAS